MPLLLPYLYNIISRLTDTSTRVVTGMHTRISFQLVQEGENGGWDFVYKSEVKGSIATDKYMEDGRDKRSPEFGKAFSSREVYISFAFSVLEGLGIRLRLGFRLGLGLGFGFGLRQRGQVISHQTGVSSLATIDPIPHTQIQNPN
jgi:hypothetical protein